MTEKKFLTPELSNPADFVQPGEFTDDETSFAYYYIRSRDSADPAKAVEHAEFAQLYREEIGNDRAEAIIKRLEALVAHKSEPVETVEPPMRIIIDSMGILPEGEVEPAGSKDRGASPTVRGERISPRRQFVEQVLTELGEPYILVSDPGQENKLYQAYLVPSLHKIIEVCNLAGNPTFVIHEVDNPEHDWGSFARLTKSGLRDLGKERVSELIGDPNSERWKTRLIEVLMESSKKERQKIIKDLPQKEWISSVDLAKLGQAILQTGDRLNTQTAQSFQARFTVAAVSRHTLREGRDYEYVRQSGKVIMFFSPAARESLLKELREQRQKMDRFPLPPEGAKPISKVIREIMSVTKTRLDASEVRASLLRLVEKLGYTFKSEDFNLYRCDSATGSSLYFSKQLSALVVKEMERELSGTEQKIEGESVSLFDVAEDIASSTGVLFRDVVRKLKYFLKQNGRPEESSALVDSMTGRRTYYISSDLASRAKAAVLGEIQPKKTA